MDLLSNPWIIALFTFFVGIGGGIYIHRSKYSSNGGETEKLKSEKDALQAEFDEYKSSVADHFSQTSEMFNNLTQDYVKVYRHLAEGSQALSNTEHPVPKLGLSEEQLTASIKQIENTEVSGDSNNEMEAPRDYAPKPQDKDTEGTLSEAFSIKSGSQEAQEAEEVLEPGEKKLA